MDNERSREETEGYYERGEGEPQSCDGKQPYVAVVFCGYIAGHDDRRSDPSLEVQVGSGRRYSGGGIGARDPARNLE